MNYNQLTNNQAFLERQGELLKTYRQKLEEVRKFDKKEAARVEKKLREAEILYEEQAYNQRFFELIIQKKSELDRIIASPDDDKTKSQDTDKIVNELRAILEEGEQIDRNIRRLKLARIWRIVRLALFPFWRD
jgi:ribosome-interacting GTPase 1